MIFNAEKLFNKIQYPALIHCKSGADRAGIMSVLYKLIQCNQHPKIAKKQLSFKFLHVKWAKTGVLDSFISEYEQYYLENKNAKFLNWVDKFYNPKELEKNFRENKFIDKLLFKLMKRE